VAIKPNLLYWFWVALGFLVVIKKEEAQITTIANSEEDFLDTLSDSLFQSIMLCRCYFSIPVANMDFVSETDSLCEITKRLAEWARKYWDEYNRLEGLEPIDWDVEGRQKGNRHSIGIMETAFVA
jgi:hypothetical protein